MAYNLSGDYPVAANYLIVSRRAKDCFFMRQHMPWPAWPTEVTFLKRGLWLAKQLERVPIIGDIVRGVILYLVLLSIEQIVMAAVSRMIWKEQIQGNMG